MSTDSIYLKHTIASVCMATFNGEKYLQEQLLSILSQLNKNDELVIVDDASTDKTVAIILSLHDSRIRLYTSDENKGHVKSFERAIKLATGNIIFLSDQDDIWMPNKYKELLTTFNNSPETSLIVHGLSKINSDGVMISKDWLKFKDQIPNRSIYLFKQLRASDVFGSALAFRRSMLSLLLPFPACVYAHDHWMTIIAVYCGKIKLHSGQLVLRRIHTNNITPENGLVIYMKIYFRVIFLWLIFLGLYRLANSCSNEWRIKWKN